MTVMVFAAHPDDEVLGPGATIAKYAKQEPVIVVIFSFGDSKLWARLMEPGKARSRLEIIKVRMKETQRACDILGVKKVIFLGLSDANIAKEVRDRKVEKRVKALIEKYKPRLILYHSQKDGHVDHLAVNKLLTKVIFELDYKPKVMTYQINRWDILGLRHAQYLEDVTDTFKLKLKALEKYKSQRFLINLLKKVVILKSLLAGKKMGVKYAEPFYEV